LVYDVNNNCQEITSLKSLKNRNLFIYFVINKAAYYLSILEILFRNVFICSFVCQKKNQIISC